MTAKEVFGDWRLIFFWLAMVAAGGIAGFVGGWVWRDRTGALANVSILAALTAFGTVGAVWFSVWQSIRLRTAQEDQDKKRLSSLAITINEAVESLEWNCEHLSNVLAGKEPLNSIDVESFLFSVSVVTRIPFHEYPYCLCHKDLYHTVYKLKNAAKIIEKGLSKGCFEPETLKQLRTQWEIANAEFNAALQKPSFQGVTRPMPAYVQAIPVPVKTEHPNPYRPS